MITRFVVFSFLFMLKWALIIGGILIILAAIRHEYRQRKILLKLRLRMHGCAVGIVFGKTPWRLVCSEERDFQHVLSCGGSGSGKTSSVLIPTLKAWRGMAFVIDISGDTEKNTNVSGKTIYNPENEDTTPYSVFAAVDSAATIAEKNESLQQLSFALIPPAQGDSDVTVFYKGEARKMCFSALVAYYHSGLDFIQICKKIVGLSYETLIADLNASANELAMRLVAGFKEVNERILASIKSELDNAVLLFATNPNMERTIRRGTDAVSPQVLEKRSVYIVIADTKLKIYAPLFRLITEQILTHLSGRENGKQPPILICLDEFASLGKIDILDALRKLRKKNVRVLICTQSLADLDLTYGQIERRAIIDNIPYKVVLSANEYETQQYFSNLAGERTVILENGIECRRKVIPPEDFARLKNHLILLHPGGVTRLKKNFYFKKWIF